MKLAESRSKDEQGSAARKRLFGAALAGSLMIAPVSACNYTPYGLDASRRDSSLHDGHRRDGAGKETTRKTDALHDGPKKPDALGHDSAKPDSHGKTDAKSFVCASVTTGTFNGFITTKSALNIAGYSIGYKGVDGSGNAILAISCPQGTIAGGLLCPMGVETDIPRPSDGMPPAGRTIKINPSSASASFASIVITITHP